MTQSKEQQLQFFRDCLLPQQGINARDIDLYAYVDGELTTYENWIENIKPRARVLTAESYDWVTEAYVKNELEKYEALRERD
jgi:hypothetical protein